MIFLRFFENIKFEFLKIKSLPFCHIFLGQVGCLLTLDFFDF